MLLPAAGAPATAAALVETSSAVGQDANELQVNGGADVADGALPWVVALVAAGDPDPSEGRFCTGTLVHPQVVLTAAHCVSDLLGQPNRPAELIDVVAGTADLTTGTRIRARAIHVHPGWTGDIGSPGDAAAIVLSAPTSIEPVRLATAAAAAAVAAGEPGWIAGYGAVDAYRSLFTTRLQAAEVPILADADCDDVYGSDYLPGMNRCAGAEDGIGTCAGDSGGPLYVYADDGTALQLGITSWGPTLCGRPARPGVFTDVAFAAPWVAAVVLAYFPPPPPAPPVPPPPPEPPAEPPQAVATPPAPAAAPTGTTAPAPPAVAAPIARRPAVRIRIEGFRTTGWRPGRAVPRAAVRPGGRLARCARPQALVVVFSYARAAAGQRVVVRWFRNGRPYANGRAVTLRRSAGRATLSVARRVEDGRFRAELWLDGRRAARAAVVKDCR